MLLQKVFPWWSGPRRQGNVAIVLLLGALGLTGCSTGINKADSLCASSSQTAATFAQCLRNNYETLAGPFSGDGDVGALYLAKAEEEAALVRSGSISDSKAMLELATFRTNELAPITRKRQNEDFDKFMKAINDARNDNSSSASKSTASTH